MADGPVIEEIRFNERYANLIEARYPSDQFSEDSVPTIKKKTLFTEDYLKRLNESLSLSIIPPNCRYVEETQKGYLVVIEEPPAYRTIKVDFSMESEIDKMRSSGKLQMYGYENFLRDSSRPYKFQLAFPYVIFILYINKYFEIHDGQVYTRTQQMSGLSDYLLKMPMSNISDSGHICFGDHIGGRHRSLMGAIQHAIMVFWSASFNTDYMYNYHDYVKKNIPILSSYLEWQYMSQANPMFIYNADWIRMSYNIGQRLEETKSRLRVASKKAMGYRELSEVFFTTQETGIKEKSYKKSKKSYTLYYDIAQGTYLTGDMNVNVGDSFTTHKGKIAFIDTFAGFVDGSDVRYVVLDIEGQKVMMKLHTKSKDFLAKKIHEQRTVDQVTLPNGENIKPQDIVVVKMNGTEAFYRVEYIRKSRGMQGEEIFEVRMGSNYFLSHNLDATKFDVGEPEIDGIKVVKDEQYIIVRDNSYQGALTNAYRMYYDSVDVTSSGTIVLRFRNAHPALRGSTRNVDLSRARANKAIYKIDEVKRLNGVFRVGRKLFYMTGGRDAPITPEVAWAAEGIVFREGNFSLNNVKAPDTLKTLVNGDRFFVEGADFDIEFKIGDKVVCANWDNPLDVLTVKMIQGFKIDEREYGRLSFILADREGKLSEQLYIDGSQNGLINVGKIRKVTNKIGRLSAGTKIKANVAGIPCFPKKDVNIIVAFIIDTGTEPLVLCSNGCTLWLKDVEEHFSKTTMKSKKWPKMPHAPLDLTKIKFQAGDIINGTRDYKTKYGFLLYGPSPTRALRAMPLEYFHSRPESYCLDRYMTRECRLDCIPAPRIVPAKLDEIGVVRGTFNFHSYDVTENKLETRYINQRRT